MNIAQVEDIITAMAPNYNGMRCKIPKSLIVNNNQQKVNIFFVISPMKWNGRFNLQSTLSLNTNSLADPYYI